MAYLGRQAAAFCLPVKPDHCAAVPPLLADIQLITFFVDLDAAPLGRENGEDWRLLAYPSLSGLTPMTRPGDAPALHKGFECRWEACDDHPNYDDPELVVPDGFDNSEAELENAARTKIGGYASSIQSEPWWGSEDHPAAPAYCLQINSEEKVGLAWGDARNRLSGSGNGGRLPRPMVPGLAVLLTGIGVRQGDGYAGVEQPDPTG